MKGVTIVERKLVNCCLFADMLHPTIEGQEASMLLTACEVKYAYSHKLKQIFRH